MATHFVPNSETAGTSLIDTSRYECIGGNLIERAVPGIPHGLLQKRIVRLLDDQLASTGRIAVGEVSLDKTPERNSEWLTPDVIVSMPGGFRMKQSNSHAFPPAFLAIEILSAGQTFENLRWKAEDYLAWGVEHVWFLDSDSASAMTFDGRQPDRDQLVSEGSLSVGDFLSIPLATIFE